LASQGSRAGGSAHRSTFAWRLRASALGAARRRLPEFLRLTAVVASALGAARRRLLEYLRLTAAVASALGAARRRSQEYLRLTAAVASALGAARRRLLEHLRLTAAVPSALGAARRRLLGYLRLTAAVPSALGAARRRSCPPQWAAPAPAPLLRCAARPAAGSLVGALRTHHARRIRPVGRSAPRNRGGGRRVRDIRGAWCLAGLIPPEKNAMNLNL